MGKGVAKRFKEIFPEMFEEYRSLCEDRKLKIGSLHLYRAEHKYVLNFPTKKHWRSPSKVEYIRAGLQVFSRIYEEAGITSISFPPLGCGNGGLDFETVVRPVMEESLERLPIPVFIHLYDRYSVIPEHKRPDEIKRWLRSQPRDLSFWEVWDDIRDILHRKSKYRTFARNSSYEVDVMEGRAGEPVGLRVTTESKTSEIDLENIRTLWQQLRSYGFISAPDAPAGLQRDMSYLGPVLAELPYVGRERLSDDYGQLKRQARYGLKFVMPSEGPAMAEPDLFGYERVAG